MSTRSLNEIVGLLKTLPSVDRLPRTERLIRLGEYQEAIGWGYGEFLADIEARAERSLRRHASFTRSPFIGGQWHQTRDEAVETH
jgi:hypothetical protein